MAAHEYSDDDGFDDFLSEGEEEWTMQAQEMAALERSMKTVWSSGGYRAGIRDGIEFGKEDTLQQGFDQGFRIGATSSYRFSVLRGALSAAKACGLLASLSAEERDRCDVWIAKLKQHAMQSAFPVALQQQAGGDANGLQPSPQQEDDVEDVVAQAQRLLGKLQLSVSLAACAAREGSPSE